MRQAPSRLAERRSVYFGPFQLDLANRLLLHDGQPLKVRPKTFAVLVLLVERAGQIVSRDEIFNGVWSDISVQDQVLTTSITELRRLFRDTRKSAQFIETIHGRGVRFTAAVTNVLATPSEANAAADTTGSPRTALIGRESVIRALERTFEESLHGDARIALVQGAAGIGKSRLLEEIATRAQHRGAMVLRASADSGQHRPSYWIWSQLVRATAVLPKAELRAALGSSVDDVATLVPSLHDRLGTSLSSTPEEASLTSDRFFNAVTAFLRNLAAMQPLVLVIDDVEHADASSLALLQAATESLRAERFLVVAARRNADQRGTNLSDALTAWQRAGQSVSLELARLSDEESAQLISAIASVALPRPLLEQIVHDTSGNPYFLCEIGRGIDAHWLDTASERGFIHSIPESLQRYVDNRFSALPVIVQRLLRAGAVAGSEFDAHSALRMAEVSQSESVTAVAEALAAGFLEEPAAKPGRLRFTSNLLRETLLLSIPKLARAELEGRLSETPLHTATGSERPLAR